VKIVYSILSNKTVTVPMIAWFVAQFLKVVNSLLLKENWILPGLSVQAACRVLIPHLLFLLQLWSEK